MLNISNIRETIELLYDSKTTNSGSEFRHLFGQFIDGLNSGLIRAAEYHDGEWQVNNWVKKGILLGFRYGKLKDYSSDKLFSYFDKETIPLKPLTINDNVRVVMGGSSVRTGAYVASGVVIMPPGYINIGAYVDKETMIDSHALVGSCAQIGKRVHLSAGAMIGGVLEPIGSMPVIVEDDVFIGGNCGIYEGVIVKSGAVLGSGTILTSSVPVFDIFNERILRATSNHPLTIPENAVLVPGSRPLQKSGFAGQNGLHLNCPVIIKYRDDSTRDATLLEVSLR